ncbi:MAG: gfo/Idh/MocA family oxidoreductase, partial [Verrucomicrobiae bacterium]|nr:gfo/Idh/MocA family oxidoreductase [Verrucomicrobiae bacterium]
QGEDPPPGLWNTPVRCRLSLEYPNNVTMILASGYPHIHDGVRWIGDQGWIRVDRDTIEASPRSLLDERIGPWETNLRRTSGHHRDFLDCVKTRQPTLAPVEAAQRSSTAGHLAQLAMLLGRKIRWNPLREEVLEDATAARLLGRAYREPWRL